MPLRLYNTLTRKLEPFEPMAPPKVGVYACGITAYDLSHLGHARALVTYDLVVRYLKHLGYQVTFVRNFTDIDDKIIARANEKGEDPKALAERFIGEFHTDTAKLNLLRPDHEPRATEVMDAIIELTQRLISRGMAYAADGDVFFAVESFKTYGKLSGKALEDLVAGARVDVNRVKRNPLDFNLWKASKPGEPSWDSPWGRGRPGWHIECSAMSMGILGETFDIHMGGLDLIFPHHENEIAQSEGCTGKPFARYWIHNGFVNINQEKMSKSLGNFFTLRDLLGKYPGEVLRAYILGTHHTKPLDYSDDELKQAESGLKKLYETLAHCQELLKRRCPDDPRAVPTPQEQKLLDQIAALPGQISEFMDDDFNAAGSLGAVQGARRAVNEYLLAHDFRATPVSCRIAEGLLAVVPLVRDILGILYQEPKAFLDDLGSRVQAASGITEPEILALIGERKAARAAKNFARADEIRKELDAKGVEIKDSPQGTTWNWRR
ncbi:MAG: cysteine--tRNA ligase [Deltaproteobacteria bacterium]|nr:cysteine--tRNA ligase [Deltaproteobacteria bacterium]